MDKYTVEGNLDFYNELYKMLDENPKEGEGECGDMCLITNMPLGAFFVTLGCNHKFNYMPLFNEIQNQKLKVNTLSTTHLQNNQVMCPYCRCNNNGVLPFHEELEVNKIYGINTLDVTYKLPNECFTNGVAGCFIGVCEYKTVNQNNENIPCNNKWVYKIKDNTGCYCYSHKVIILTNIMAEKKIKAKQAKLAQNIAKKLAIKEQKLASKLAVQTEAKAQKDAAKTAIKAQKDAAKAASSSSSKKPNPKHNPTTLELCTEILKSGKNSGTQCKCKALLNGKCGRHAKVVSTNTGENIIISTNSFTAFT